VQLIRDIGEFSMIVSKIDRRFRTTLPARVRDAPRLQDGDEVAYTITETERVILTRRIACENPFIVFCEWDGDADAKAYRNL
jgi:antitoxin PrlF